MPDRQPRCQPVDLDDGTTAHVRATGPLTDTDRQALAEIADTLRNRTRDGRPCRRCGQEIAWATTLLGRPMPIDPHPTEDGNLAVWRDPNGHLLCRVLARDEPPAAHEHRARPHFATCPNWGKTPKETGQ
jgi:hypothetical protein